MRDVVPWTVVLPQVKINGNKPIMITVQGDVEKDPVNAA
jgi:hypothetical protein